jgi:hypothetical protein
MTSFSTKSVTEILSRYKVLGHWFSWCELLLAASNYVSKHLHAYS